MCNIDPKDPFADLESDLDGAPVRESASNPHVEDISDIEIPGFEETCPKCRGRGRFISYGGRDLGNCFKCKGKGKLVFKTAPEARAKARKSATKRKARNEAASIAAFTEAHPAEAKWLADSDSSFATSLTQSIAKHGNLTDKQLAAVRNNIAKEADAEAGISEWAENHEAEHNWLVAEDSKGNEFAASLLSAVKRFGSLTEGQLNAVRRNLDKAAEEAPSDLDISGLKGFYAVPNGDTRLKLRVRKPGKLSRYHGWTFVDDGAAYGSRTTYGKQAPDGLYVGRVQDQLREILKDPLAAQKAYGHLTGVCGRCGQLLENEESVAAGIGPICATKV